MINWFDIWIYVVSDCEEGYEINYHQIDGIYFMYQIEDKNEVIVFPLLIKGDT